MQVGTCSSPGPSLAHTGGVCPSCFHSSHRIWVLCQPAGWHLHCGKGLGAWMHMVGVKERLWRSPGNGFPFPASADGDAWPAA